MKRAQLERFTAKNVAEAELANRLKRGELALFLGAGVTSSYGVPTWASLVDACCTRIKGVAPLGASSPPSTQQILDKTDEIRRACKGIPGFMTVVSKALYGTHHSAKTDFDGTPLMRALGVAMMGGRRGSIQDVVTVNFDSLLESHLQLHGYITQSIASLPCLEKGADVRIYHPNGYLPQDASFGERSDPKEFIFDSLSFDKRLGDSNGPWNNMVRGLLLRKIGLVIGLSTSEDFVRTTVKSVQDQIEPTDRPVCFWLLSKTDKDGIAVSDLNLNCERLLERGSIPVILDSFDDYPKFIFDICKRAAQI